jgi:hypothetical protein
LLAPVRRRLTWRTQHVDRVHVSGDPVMSCAHDAHAITVRRRKAPQGLP